MKRRDEVSVGIVITVAVVVLLAGVLWLARGGLTSGYPLYTRFSWGQNLKQGQPVLLAGVNVGHVDQVTLNPGGFLDVTLRINKATKVPRTATSTVRAVGFFGDVAVALTPKLSGSLTEAFAPGDTIPAGPPEAGVAEILSKADSVSTAVNHIILAMQQQVVDAGGLRDLRLAISSTAALTRQLQAIAAEQNRNLAATLAAYRRVADAVDTAQVAATVSNLQAATSRAATAAARFDSATTQLNQLMARANDPNSTLGLLLSDSTLYRNLRNTLATADSLMADIKAHPGRYISVHIF
ncbi:MAG TPA: MlaD family protein [Gemmatimonadaceae bacterium]|jgi:phospholipid/cholesterol/gamma-HCH transport system substrate-binding protein|nr:MlaD family protein [Gemmatimonadaceae bacterium]